MTRRLGIIGMGKMGRAIEQLAPERGWTVVARLDEGDAVTRESLNGADVAVEFTVAGAAPANVRAAVDAGCPVVVGTTGWQDRMEETAAYVESHGGALLTAPNFSVGVNVFERIVETAARLLAAAPGFDAHMVETHHAAKKDAPSGTALRLAEVAAGARAGKPVPITSVRTGSVPGTHELVFDAPFEQIALTHVARDRRVFAEGAMVAAAWLVGKKGVYTMKDVLSQV